MLSGQEALRIAQTHALALADFLELLGRDAPEADFRIGLRGPDDRSRRHCRLQLRRIATPSAAHAQRCTFLHEQSGRVLCGIYPVRPRACAAFPYQEAGPVVKLSRLARALCPPSSWAGLPIDTVGHQLLRRQQECERAVYDAVIDVWNAMLPTVGPWPTEVSFFSYLTQSFALLAQREPALLVLPTAPQPREFVAQYERAYALLSAAHRALRSAPDGSA